jgi:general stress protein 26
VTVWVTHPVSRKVAQIRAPPEVALHYVDIERMAQVTLKGLAQLHDDAATPPVQG